MPQRLRSYRDVLRDAVAGTPHPLADFQRRRLLMMDSLLQHRGVLRATEQTVAYLATRPAVVEELEELREVLESGTSGRTFHLFVRTDPDAAFCFLGPIRYETHEGDRPIAITWRLETPMPAALYEQDATRRAG